jgi:hypothetical protein
MKEAWIAIGEWSPPMSIIIFLVFSLVFSLDIIFSSFFFFFLAMIG